MKVVVVLGTRPEAIKLSPVILELKSHKLETVVISTGQHRDMVDHVLEWFGISPDINLKLMTADQPLCLLTRKLLDRLPKLYRKYKPDLVMVQGDTTSAMAGALAAFYEGFPVAHVEAGLRTYNNLYPFPEEANRRMISSMATYHFAPTQMAADNLLREGIPSRDIFVTGNTGIDALCWALHRNPPKCKVPQDRKRLILVTIHRRENWGIALEHICDALICIVQRNQNIEINFPVHPNPKVHYPVHCFLDAIENIYPFEPLEYPDMVKFLYIHDLVLTDSGGIQEEAAYLGKPCLVLRNETERREGIEAGVAKLVGMDMDRIIEETERLLSDEALYQSMRNGKYIYGDGHAVGRIVDTLTQENMECQIPRFQQQSLCATAKST